MAQEEVTYESLVNRWKKELRSSQIGKLDPSFYAAVDEHLRALQTDYDREYQVNPQSAKAMILQDELRNLTKVRDDLFEVREKKIVMAALASARGSNYDKTPLTRGEADLYENLVRVLKEGRREILRRGERDFADAVPPAPTPPPAPAAAAPAAAAIPPTPAAPAPAPAPGPAAPALEAPPQPAPQAAAAAPAAEAAAPVPARRKGSHVLVRMLEDVAPFMGNDLRAYRLSREDVAAVPKEIATALVARGKAAPIGAPA